MAGQNIEIDYDAGGSEQEDDQATLSTSIASSVREYRHEYGRRYHAFKDGAYFMPNDDKETERLDLQHNIFLKAMDGELQYAPIPAAVKNVLDIGTGTGNWAIDFAERFPDAKVIATDLSPIQPSWVPPNLNFLIDDAEDDWVFEEKFDFIHGRMLCASFKDWPRFIQQSFEHLNPGGWVELQDVAIPILSEDGSLTPDTALHKWSDRLLEACGKIGRPMDAAKSYKKWMEEAGFVDVKEIYQKWPQNPWPKDPKLKEIGLWNMTNMLDGLEGMSLRLFTGALGMSKEEVEDFLDAVKRDIKDPKIRSYSSIYYVYGRKPE